MNSHWKSVVSSVSISVLVLTSCQKTESPGGTSAGTSTETAPGALAATPDLHPPFGILDSPKENEAVAAGAWAYGWALDESGVAEVLVRTEKGPAAPAAIGRPFPGVREAYPNYPDADKAGFIFAVSALVPGSHTLTVTIVAKDGGKTEIKRQIQIR